MQLSKFLQHSKKYKKNFLMNHCFGTESQRGNQIRNERKSERENEAKVHPHTQKNLPNI